MSNSVSSLEDSQKSDEFMSLLMGHRHRLFAYIAKQLVNPSDVEDVFQKASVVLWKKMDQFDPTKSFFHWACGIAFNEVRRASKYTRGCQRIHSSLTCLPATTNWLLNGVRSTFQQSRRSASETR